MRLKDRTAIIVGAGQQQGETMGNGRAAALRFAQEGARLLLVDIDQGRAEQTAEECRKVGAETHLLAADITQESACCEIAQTGQQLLGRIDILHNNVGRSRGDKATPTPLSWPLPGLFGTTNCGKVRAFWSAPNSPSSDSPGSRRTARCAPASCCCGR